jgi:DNA topoisomerase VI subunit B
MSGLTGKSFAKKHIERSALELEGTTAARKLERQVFETSRLLEYFSEKELSMQLGHARDLWALVLVKELVDNGLDACECAGILPEIRLYLSAEGFAVRDNGPGLPESTLMRSLDYAVRVSDKVNYVSPSRGQLGNALKTVWAAPFVVDGEHGQVEVSMGGKTHTVTVTLDRIEQRPSMSCTVRAGGLKRGTLVKIPSPKLVEQSSSEDPCEDSYFYNRAVNALFAYALFNPAATFVLKTKRGAVILPRADENWRHWLPSEPTSPHWYSIEKFINLIAAYLSRDRTTGRDKTVREFVSEFRGLAATAKQKEIAQESGLAGAYLKDLVIDGAVDAKRASTLLCAMKSRSAPVNPEMLGILGEEIFLYWLVKVYGVDQQTIRYKKAKGTTSQGLPYIVEAGFAKKSEEDSTGRTVAYGLNWSPIVGDPFGDIESLLGWQRVDDFDDVVVAVHIACPSLEFTDRGKRSLSLPDEIDNALESCIENVTAQWKKIKKRSDRDDRVRERDLESLRKRDKSVSIKDAAFQVMQQAYMHTSGNGAYPAKARQIMYSARPLVLDLTGGKCWSNSAYFTQELLIEFMEQNLELTASWDVVFDARGHLTEPHTGEQIGLGTLEVREYMKRWTNFVSDGRTEQPTFEHSIDTRGPDNRFRFALFIEKEGFGPLLATAHIAERFDVAIMSTKGMSVTAARRLVDELSFHGVTILVVHDFDKSAFSILQTLQSDSRRYKFKNAPKVVDLGLRLADVREMNLQSEPVPYQSKVDPRENLRQNGATEDECNFLVERNVGKSTWLGKRVELNALTSPQFITWLETKLIAVGCAKFVPDDAAIIAAFKRAVRLKELERLSLEAKRQTDSMEISIPKGLTAKVRKTIKDTAEPWDAAVWNLAKVKK